MQDARGLAIFLGGAGRYRTLCADISVRAGTRIYATNATRITERTQAMTTTESLRIGRWYQRRDGGTASLILGLPVDEDGTQWIYSRYRGGRTGGRVRADAFIRDHVMDAEASSHLSPLENELLERILDESGRGTIRTVTFLRKRWDASEASECHDWPTLAILVWTDEDGATQCGPVRWGHRNSRPGQCDRWSASPFPGAWTDVPKSRILIVRHPDNF